MAGILSVILAGGAGTRLYPLTETRTKPAVPFGGGYRLIDFALNNFVNSDLLKIYVLTQFKSQSLNVHLRQAWYLSSLTDHFIDPIPAQMRMGKRWYEGTADAIYQNMRLIEIHDPDQVCIFGSDHIYKMDIRQMIDFHKRRSAQLTVAAIKVPVAEAHLYGVVQVDEQGRMTGFVEKPQNNPPTIPGDPEHVLASMGNYVFDTQTLFAALKADAKEPGSTHDFGLDILTKLYQTHPVYVYDFASNVIPNEPNSTAYWRDVGTIDSFWQSNMDLLADDPPLDLFNPKWPLRSYHPPVPPAKYLDSTDGQRSEVSKSMVASGCVIRGAKVRRCVLGFNVDVQPGTELTDVVFLGDSAIGQNCRISRALIDKDVEIADGVIIGEDLDADKERYKVSPSGIVVIPKGSRIGF
ncbi:MULTISPECIES: glucose-1-phosphate adenylyltransferase [Corallincola]|uniref:Glucose-1-phosphate adenylyltransferase n=3 Tax=Corallincola TaxID=1775176 RepID=A0A368NP56_9GAMM|nr:MULTISPECIES: glucose-1-phosphate adenylyltransferase [Corallincola]RCU51645.1 glucose-1-phosphate adenylyltransferase [Corallincola holothuriorum]TAA47146.1 glucose-1-phosphate adenylyltransferase [Corallincola spongiicola]TCI04803.1 glucose-1-phosphate adenylyltransferase [Corallincola luteus]